MTSAAPKVTGTRSDRFAPFLSSPLGSALCIVVSGVCYFVAIRLIDLWPFALLAPMPMVAAAFAAPSRTRAALCAEGTCQTRANDRDEHRSGIAHLWFTKFLPTRGIAQKSVKHVPCLTTEMPLCLVLSRPALLHRARHAQKFL